jgi:hypothetical protein
MIVCLYPCRIYPACKSFVTCDASGSTIPYHTIPFCTFPHYLINDMIFRRKKLLSTKCVFPFSLHLFLKPFSFYEESSKILTYTYTHIHVRHSFFLSRFNQTSIFPTDFRKILEYQTSQKSAEREPSCSTRTNIRKFVVAFRGIADTPNNG